jgi:hypothetical protein
MIVLLSYYRWSERHMTEKLTLTELFALFGRGPDDSRWVGSADSAEYLTVVTYLVQRSNPSQS